MIRAIAALLNPADRRLLRLQVGLVVLYSVLQGIAFLLLVPVLDRLLNDDDGGAARWTVALALVALAAAAAFYAQAMLAHRLGGRVARELHRRLGDHLAALPLGWFTAGRDAEVARLSGQGVTDVMGGVVHLTRPVVAAIVTPATVVAAMYLLEWRLALLTTLTIPPILLAHRLSGRIARSRAGALHAAADEAGARIVEFARRQPVLRAYGGPARRDHALEAALDAQHRARRGQLWAMSGGLVATAAAVQLSFIVVLVLGVEFALDGSVPTAELVALLVLVARFGQPLVEAADLVGALRTARNGLRAIERVLATATLPVAADPQEPRGHAVRFEAVEFAYAERPVLSGLDLDLPERGVVAVVGPSGAGKSTVARLIARFWDVTAGRVSIGGVDVREIAPATLMGLVAPVFQDVYLFEGTLRDNIRVGRPAATDAEVAAAAAVARVDEIVARLPGGWDAPVGEGGSRLSGGERQRVSLARAVVKGAPIVLLDEATAAVDVENEAAVQRAVQALAEERLVLVIAHRLATVVAADRIIFLADGRVAEQGTHDQLLAAGGRYAAFWARRDRAAGWRLAP